MERTPNKRGLYGEASRKEALGKKLRVGKKDTSLSKGEREKQEKILPQGREWIYKEYHQTTADEREEGGEDLTAEYGNFLGELGKELQGKERSSPYGRKLKRKEKDREETSFQKNEKGFPYETKYREGKTDSKEAQKEANKKKIQRQRTKEQGTKRRKAGIVFGKKQNGVSSMAESMGMLFQEKKQSHLLLVFAFLVGIVVLSGAFFSSCAMVTEAVTYGALASSYTAEEEEILESEEAYRALEEEVEERLESIETEYPGYDEYRYEVDEIGHDPHDLAALLTVLFEDYTKEEVEGALASFVSFQYELTTEEIIEIETRTETVRRWEMDHSGNLVEVEEEVEIEEEIQVLMVRLKNKGVEGIVEALSLWEDQLQRFRLLQATKGNHPEYFGEGIAAAPVVRMQARGGFRPRAEYLTKEQFRGMMECAMDLLGTPYVWGGSMPETGFDCSGFVSYVLNNSGNGWEVGRQNVRGLVNICIKIEQEEALPGDLIFFQGTTKLPGVSHVGIYVGDGMMIHCGDPVSFTSIETAYWQEHFHSFGRME